MKRSRFTESQIVSILKEADAGAKTRSISTLQAKLNAAAESGRPFD